MSRVKPMLFNSDMVRAILDGRKTVTRRVCKDGNDYTVPDMSFYDADKRTYAVHNYADKEHTDKLSIVERTCLICPGDILYVRETWKYYEKATGYGETFHVEQRLAYKADENRSDVRKSSEWYEGKWCPSIHMPKEAARIWLKVTAIKVERLQGITEEQAQAEGCNSGMLTGPCTARGQFENLWNSTLKKSDLSRYGWDASPWVWAIEFEQCEKPEPCILRGVEPAEDKRPCIGYGTEQSDEPCEMCKSCKQCIGNDEFERYEKPESEE